MGNYIDSDRKNVMVSASRLRKKLEAYAGLERMIETVWGRGYCFRG
jgi:DNA-binding response OmpR family regulator